MMSSRSDDRPAPIVGRSWQPSQRTNRVTISVMLSVDDALTLREMARGQDRTVSFLAGRYIHDGIRRDVGTEQ